MEHCHSHGAAIPCQRSPAADMHHMMMQHQGGMHPSAAVVAAAAAASASMGAGVSTSLPAGKYQFYTYSFEETSFIAVTAYQNDGVRI